MTATGQPDSNGTIGGRDNTAPNDVVLGARDLTRTFRVGGLRGRHRLHAVDEATFSIGAGEIVALVGESGSGKSTIARLLAGVYAPSSGEIVFRGRSLSTLRSRAEQLAYRAAVPMVFQDPFSSLNPAFRISHGILRGMKLHRPDVAAGDREAEVVRLLELVGLRPAAEMMQRFPHELSGGQRQRVGFAQALALRPEVILADEPVSMLDISVRIGLLNLMAGMRDQEGVSLLYITHDIASARYVADEMMVMYAGRVVETGPTEDVLQQPRHPYTQLLVAAVPDPRSAPAVTTESARGEPPKVIDPRPGCRFADRCPLVMDVCRQVTPPLVAVAPGVRAACHAVPAVGPDQQAGQQAVQGAGQGAGQRAEGTEPTRL